ncbi:MAG: hypothetical protein ACLSTO_05850 [Bilophila wadsworthia]
MTKQIITAETVRLAWKAGESVIVYAKGDIVTQQAQDDARHYGITLTTETPVAPSSALAEPEEAVPPVPPVLEESAASWNLYRSHAGVDRRSVAPPPGSRRKRWSR